MKTRLLALALAGVMALGLGACGGDQPTPAPEGDPSAAVETDAPDVAITPDPETLPEVEHETLPVAPPDQPSPTPEQVTGPMEPTATPEPSATPKPTAPASETPASETPPQNEAAALTATAVRSAVSQAAGVSYDDATAYLDAFYTTLNTADLADYAFSMPPMSTQIEELFVAQVKSGRMDAVKAACRDRQAAMAEDAAFYGTTGAYVDGYQLLSQGDWVLFYVGPNAATAVSAFQSAVK